MAQFSSLMHLLCALRLHVGKILDVIDPLSSFSGSLLSFGQYPVLSLEKRIGYGQVG